LTYYIGIDSSSTNTGIVVLDTSGNIKDYYLISPNKALDINDRILEILKTFLKILSKYAEDNISVAIESAALYGKGKRNELSMLIGALYYLLRLEDREVFLVPPSKLKKFATGNGRASKEDMESATPTFVVQKFKREFKKVDDVVDAFWLATYCCFQYK